ncbi:MAG TPA: FAD-dependent oxidoreductase [Bacillota bacterium]|nr:FAD-dependent oxidoreductase [Bacillota bacterium]
MSEELFDVIIVGAGPAGMTAGVFTARKGLKTLVISKDIGGQVNWTTVVENYMGFKEINGPELMSKFEEQMKGNHLSYKQDEVALVERVEDNKIRVTGKKTGAYLGQRAIIATGKRPRMLNVPGEGEFRGKGVSYCSTCDAPLFRDANAAVVGGGNSGLSATIDLLGVGAKTVHLITNQELTGDQNLIDRLQSDQRVKLYPHRQVLAITGDKFVTGLKMKSQEGNEENLEVSGVFIEIGARPERKFLGRIGEERPG